MGASSWQHVIPYRDDLEAALGALRLQVFADGDFISPADLGLPAPETLSDLTCQEMYEEFMGTHGTHSILDITGGVMASDSNFQHEGSIRPLTDAESLHLFGSAKPSRADFDTAGEIALAYSVTGGRWTGRAVVLWADGKPAEIAFWGYSGD